MRFPLNEFLSAAVLCGASTIASAQSAPRIASIGWLAGCLEMQSGNRVVEEHRMTERAGTMLGMGRTVGARGLGDYELTLIKQDGDRLLFEAHPKDQPPATFTARRASGSGRAFRLTQRSATFRSGSWVMSATAPRL